MGTASGTSSASVAADVRCSEFAREECRPRQTCGSNHWSSPWSQSGSAVITLEESVQAKFQIILNEFSMTEDEQAQMMSIIGEANDKNAKKLNSEGQPLGWCYVPTLPTGKVFGTCLALDFGCSDHYFRASLFNVRSDSGPSLDPTDHRTFLLTPSMRNVDMSQFCDYVAQCLRQMLLENEQNLSSEARIYMGVSAGFDVRVKAQKNPVSATVRFASKDYKMAGFIDHDFVPYFHAAFDRAGLGIRIGTVINDTVGVLLSGIHQVSCEWDHKTDCSIAVLLNRGGSNMAYLETDREFLEFCRSNERNFLGRPRGGGYCAIVNSEAGFWIGASGELDCMANSFEDYVRKMLKVPFRLECIISGAWYAHVLHRTIQVLRATNTVQLSFDSGWTLNKSLCFEIFALCDQWYSDKGMSDLELTAKLKELLEVKELTFIEASAIAEVCHAIVGRTAEVTALGIVTLSRRIYGTVFPNKIAIAYGGSLFVTVSRLKPLLENSLRSLVPCGTEINLVLSDVSFGCAVTAICSGLRN